MKKLIKALPYILVIGVALYISNLFWRPILDSVQKVAVLEAQVESLMNREPETIYSMEVFPPEVVFIEGQKGEKGDAGETPEGHWERYCVYNKNQMGYPTKGVLIRESTHGDCDDELKVVKLWEK